MIGFAVQLQRMWPADGQSFRVHLSCRAALPEGMSFLGKSAFSVWARWGHKDLATSAQYRVTPMDSIYPRTPQGAGWGFVPPALKLTILSVQSCFPPPPLTSFIPSKRHELQTLFQYVLLETSTCDMGIQFSHLQALKTPGMALCRRWWKLNLCAFPSLCACVSSVTQSRPTLWDPTIGHQTPLSVGFPR